ncbi:MAG: histidine phosphatase family protein [Candidatus Paceibacterota bacterium]
MRKQKIDLTKYCTLYIARHGETDWNVKRIIQGHKGVGLNKQGQKQVTKLAEKLKHVRFDAIFSSDLLRAKQTAEILALERKLAVITSKTLRERTLGSFDGKKIESYKKELRDLLKKYSRLPEKEKFAYKLSNDIESDEELISRVITFLRELSIANTGKNLLVVTHGGVLQTLLIQLGYAKRRELPFGTVSNAAYIKLMSDGVDFFVEKVSGVNVKR